MRQIGEIAQRELGQRFVDYLATQDIEAVLRDADEEGPCSIWVLDEDLLDPALDSFELFEQNPEDPRFKVSPAQLKAKQKPANSLAPVIDVRQEVFRQAGIWSMPVVISLIGLCLFFTLVANVAMFAGHAHLFYFSEYYGRAFPEIAAGQVWRLITPIFIHSGGLHLIFNMMWLFQLGGMIERLEGQRTLIVMTLLIGIVCNVAQYLVSGPMFGGLSGVIYGLLAYIWMMSRYGSKQYVIAQQTFVFMMIWLVICLVGLIPNVANTQHVVGFLAGAVFGYFRSGGWKISRRRRAFKRKMEDSAPQPPQ